VLMKDSCTSGLLRPTLFLDFDLRALQQFTTVECLMDNIRRHAATTLSATTSKKQLMTMILRNLGITYKLKV